MSPGIVLISAENQPTNALRYQLEQCGLDVWTPQALNICDGHIYDSALCLIIDMPQDFGFRTLRLFRRYGVSTPALLIVDADCQVDPESLDCDGVMDVVARPSSPLVVLRWVQSMCAATKFVESSRVHVAQAPL